MLMEIINKLNPDHLAGLIGLIIGGFFFAVFRGIVVKWGDKEVKIGGKTETKNVSNKDE